MKCLNLICMHILHKQNLNALRMELLSFDSLVLLAFCVQLCFVIVLIPCCSVLFPRVCVFSPLHCCVRVSLAEVIAVMCIWWQTKLHEAFRHIAKLY